MQTTTLKRNRLAFVSLFVLLLVISGLSACGSMDLTPLHTDPGAQPAPTAPINAVAWSPPDAIYLAAATGNGSIFLWRP